MCVVEYDQEENVVRQFLSRIRQHPAYRDSLIVAIIESDLNVIDTSRFSAFFESYPPVFTLRHQRDGREMPGIRSTHENKLRYSRDLANVLEMKGICFAEDLITLTKENTEAERKEMLRKAQEQLRVFALIEEVPTRPGFQNKKVATTGKHRGMPDDIAMAIQMAVHFSKVTIMQPGFTSMLATSSRRLIGM